MNFKDTRRKISVPLAMSINLQKKSSNPSKKNRKKKSWGDLGPRSAREKLSQMLVRSGEIPSLRQTSIDKTNDCAMKSERGALVRGADPPSGHCSQNGRSYVRGGRCPGVIYKHIWALLCRKQATKNIDPSPMARIGLFFRFGRRA